ncbi:hypothetical protein FA95DRAFT_152301 [Auriscalpium vulgare]|uniref:Uncharacterized protein n=1 Tax=Auriscalpium vulgare TaxID=40419 RepID=A0ACB8RMV9_9AGAM|nr:hypothetical protein FA95DRAFT_152301 [Auriscalpium vulgare]
MSLSPRNLPTPSAPFVDMRRGFLLDSGKRARDVKTRVNDGSQTTVTSKPTPDPPVADTRPASPSSTTPRNTIHIPAHPVCVSEPKLSIEKCLDVVLEKMKADPDFRVRGYIPPDRSTFLAYWPDLKDRLLARPGGLVGWGRIPWPHYKIRAVRRKGKGMFAAMPLIPGLVRYHA